MNYNGRRGWHVLSLIQRRLGSQGSSILGVVTGGCGSGTCSPTGAIVLERNGSISCREYRVLEGSLRWGHSPDKERGSQAAGALPVTACPSRNMDMSPVWLWHHYDLTVSLKITTYTRVQLIRITGVIHVNCMDVDLMRSRGHSEKEFRICVAFSPAPATH